MAAPSGFDWSRRKHGELAITHHGREVTILRNRSADRLAERLAGASDEQAQHLLARATGNYRRGNERS